MVHALSGSPTGQNANYGVMMRYYDETIDDYNAVYSADYSDESKRPAMTITYQPSSNSLDGVCFIKYGSLCLSVDQGMIPGSTLTLQAKKSGGPAQLRQLWKIKYLGSGYYSIRSMYKLDMALHAAGNIGSTVDITTISTTDTLSAIPNISRWGIQASSSSSKFFMHVGTSSLSMRPVNGTLYEGNTVVTQVNSSGLSGFAWTIEPVSVSDQLLLINTQVGLPASDAVRHFDPGDTVTLDDLNLTASFVSQYTNAESITWTSDKPTVATVNSSTGTITGVSVGTSIITGTASRNGKDHRVSFGVCVGYPSVFNDLLDWHAIALEHCDQTNDGLFMSTAPLSVIFTSRGISELPEDANATDTRNVSVFYDDWYLFAVEDGNSVSYGLFKMREEDNDSTIGDADNPGVTISFVSLDKNKLITCLRSDTQTNRYNCLLELDKVTGPGIYDHDDILAEYFSKTESSGAYLIAEKYVNFIASFAESKTIDIPYNCISIFNELESIDDLINSPLTTEEELAALLLQRAQLARIPNALDRINSDAGYNVFVKSNYTLSFKNLNSLTIPEKQAILSCFTANETFNSFAAEVQFHADALNSWQNNVPILGNDWYERALRSDMAIGSGYEPAVYDDYYDLTSELVLAQIAEHGEY